MTHPPDWLVARLSAWGHYGRDTRAKRRPAGAILGAACRFGVAHFSGGDFTLFDGGGVDGAGGGSDGPSGGGDRVVQRFWRSDYVDAFIAQATSAWNATEEEYDAPTTQYALTDRLFSVIAMLKNDGAIAERVRYTPYGQARHEWPHDVDGNGAAGGGAFGDLNPVLAALGAYGGGSYTPDADFDQDGVVTFTELNLVLGTSLPALTGGAISDRAGVANSVGYSGYQFDPAAGPEGLYLARHRWYDPALGTWVTRDPIGYADGMGLYEYVAGDPLWGIDPWGLFNDVWIVPGIGVVPTTTGRPDLVTNPGPNYRSGGGMDWSWVDPHDILDLLGLIPVLGEPIDLAHGCWYALEGDWLNAVLCGGSMVPFAGAASIAARHSDDMIALKNMIRDATRGTNRLSPKDYDYILDLHDELGLPFRASPSDINGDHWVNGPHFHSPGLIPDHIPVEPGVTPRQPSPK